MDNLKAALFQNATELGFCAIGIADMSPFEFHEVTALMAIDNGLLADLNWYTPERVRKGSHPERIAPWGRSIISVALPYPLAESENVLGARISKYAWGTDYHDVVKTKLHGLVSSLALLMGRKMRGHICVDDGLLPDRAVAERAGVGWFGKNTNIVVSGRGSRTFLGEVIVDVEMAPDVPLKDDCGDCDVCLKACPTGALVAPYTLDSRHCIAYLTIENRGAIPRDIRPLVGDRLFGCDTCQEACPHNRQNENHVASVGAEVNVTQLDRILKMKEDEFRVQFMGSALKRAKLVGLQRNACVVLGNAGDEAAVQPLASVFSGGAPLVRAHAAWALGRIGSEKARGALESTVGRESDVGVLEEVRRALNGAP